MQEWSIHVVPSLSRRIWLLESKIIESQVLVYLDFQKDFTLKTNTIVAKYYKLFCLKHRVMEKDTQWHMPAEPCQ